MAVQGDKRQEQGEYKKIYGLGLFEILGVNMTNKQLKEAGFNVKEEDLETERTFVTEREGVKNVRLEFALKEVKKDGILRKISFFIEDREKESQSNPGSFQWINNQGACSYDGGKGIGGLQKWFTEGRDVRKAKSGEEQFMEFMRNCMAVDFRGNGVLNYDVKKFFKGNFKELQDDLKSDYCTTVVVALTIKEKDVEEEGEMVKKEFESFYNKAFAPGEQYKFVQNKREFSEADVKNITDKIARNAEKRVQNKANPENKQKTEYVNAVENLIASISSTEYPCKDRYYLGLLKEYVPGPDKVLERNDIDY